jgi:hypothetical protein
VRLKGQVSLKNYYVEGAKWRGDAASCKKPRKKIKQNTENIINVMG